MADPTQKISLGGLEFILPATARIVILNKNSFASSTKSLEENGVDYQVPSGKKFWAMYLIISNNTANGPTLIQADNADGTTNQVVKLALPSANGLLQSPLGKIEFTSSKYVNATESAGGTPNVTIIGVELNN